MFTSILSLRDVGKLFFPNDVLNLTSGPLPTLSLYSPKVDSGEGRGFSRYTSSTEKMKFRIYSTLNIVLLTVNEALGILT